MEWNTALPFKNFQGKYILMIIKDYRKSYVSFDRDKLQRKRDYEEVAYDLSPDKYQSFKVLTSKGAQISGPVIWVNHISWLYHECTPRTELRYLS